MKRSDTLFALGLASLLVTGCGGGGGGGGNVAEPAAYTEPEPTGLAPASLLSLDNWSLTLPVDDAGGTTGTADIIPSSELLAGYDSSWFYATSGDGVTFWAPVTGAQTVNSPYARSELREMLDPRNSATNWYSRDFSRLDARLIVNRVPGVNGKVVVGQVVGYNREDPDVSQLVRLVFEYNSNLDARLYALVLPGPNASTSSATRLPISSTVRLSKEFTYAITVNNNVITIDAEGSSVTAPVDPAWASTGLYFRAGSNLQATGSDPADGGKVTFYELRASH